jgi:hypothetical protein
MHPLSLGSVWMGGPTTYLDVPFPGDPANARRGESEDPPPTLDSYSRLRSALTRGFGGQENREIIRFPAAALPPAHCTAFIMSKIGRYIATTMPPTITPRTTIMIGSINESRAETATSTSSS